jgi:hypothetical protein
MDVESVSYVKHMVVVSGETMTERCWSEDSECASHARLSQDIANERDNIVVDTSYAMKRPLSSILTARAQIQTPKPGLKMFLQRFPTCFSDAINSKLIKHIEAESIEYFPVLDVNDALYDALTKLSRFIG